MLKVRLFGLLSAEAHGLSAIVALVLIAIVVIVIARWR
jgi:hypothetical protein